MIRKIFILSVLFLGAEMMSAQAGIPPLRIPRNVTRLSTGLSPQLVQTTQRLARVNAPGFGGLFKSFDRPTFLNMGSYGLNIHPMIAMHESLFPNHKKQILPQGLADLKRLENNVPDLIANPRNAEGWKGVSDATKTFLFESAIPAYLLTTADEEIVLPSAVQLGEMITYYRQILGGVGVKGLYPADYFAQQMSAVTNLGLFGTEQDAVSLLQVAQTDFGTFDRFKDLFITRALLSVGAYDALEELAQIRLNEKDSARDPLILSSVWTGVQTLASKAGKRLNIPQNRISRQEDFFPDILQREIIAHHALNYVLANPSPEVTNDWLALRAGIDEHFIQASALDGVETLLRKDLKISFTPTPPVIKKPSSGFETSPKPGSWVSRMINPNNRPAAPVRTVVPEPEDPSPVPDEEDFILELPAKPKTTPAAPVVKPEHTPVARPSAAHGTTPAQTPAKPAVVRPVAPTGTVTQPLPAPTTKPQEPKRRGRPAGAVLNTPSNVLLKLQTYISENNDQLPPRNHTLRVVIYKLFKKADPNDPAVQAIHELWNARLKPRGGNAGHQNHYADIREELQDYIEVHGGLPAPESSLCKRAKYVRETGDPNDENVRAIIDLLAENRQKNLRTPSVVRAELETYMHEHNGQLPVSNTPIRRRAEDVKAKGDPNDPDVQAIITLLKDNALRTRRTPEQVLRELEEYLADHDGKYPAHHSSLDQAIQRLLRQNPTDENEYVAAIRALRDRHVTDKNATERQRLQGDAPSASTGKVELPPQERAKQVREDLEQYIREHDGQLPPDGHPLRSAAYRVKERFDPQDENVQAVIHLMSTLKQRNGSLPDPANVLTALQTHFATNANLPLGNTPLSRNVYTLLNKGDKNNPDVQAVIALWNSHRQDRSTPAAPVRAELEQYLAEHDGKIPPYGHPVRVRAEYRIKYGDPSDPDIIFMKGIFEDQVPKRIKRTPAQVREELETYLAEHNDQLPPHTSALDQALKKAIKREPDNPDSKIIFSLLKARQKRPNTPTPQDRSPKQLRADLETYFSTHETLDDKALYQAVNKILKNGNADDPDIQAIRQLWEDHRQVIRRTSQQVYEEVQAFFNKHGHLPNDNGTLQNAAHRKMEQGDPQDPYVQALQQFWQEKRTQTRAAALTTSFRTDLEKYLAEHDGKLPPDGHSLRSRYRYLLKNSDPNDPDVIAIKDWWQAHIPPATYTPASVRQELETYLQENENKLPPHGHPLRGKYYYMLKKSDPNDPDIIAIRTLVDENKQKKTPRTPQSVLDEMTQYLAEHDDQLPPHRSALQTAAADMIKKFPNDPLVKELELLVLSRQQRPNRTPRHDRSPKQLRADLEDYAASYNTLSANSLLFRAAKQVVRKSDPNDPDIQAIQLLLDKLRLTVKRTPQAVYQDVQAYYNRNGHLPNDGRGLHAAALLLMKKGDPEDPSVVALRAYWQEKKTKAVTDFWTEREVTGETPTVPHPMNVPLPEKTDISSAPAEQLREELNLFIRQNGRIPQAQSANEYERQLRIKAERIIKEALHIADLLIVR